MLHVTVVEGKDLKNTDTFGKMSPVCTVQVGNVAQATPKSKKGGSNPKFNCVLKPIRIDTKVGLVDPVMLQIRVHDKDSPWDPKQLPTSLAVCMWVGVPGLCRS
jgi:Ca2+-dependent lipid-binding protein